MADPYTYLLSLARFSDRGRAAYKPGLERVVGLLAAMDNPHRAYPIIHVAGTNGKGSTASMVAAIGTAHGHRTGLHTSPHLFDVRERMRIDGVPVPPAWLAEAVARYQPVMDAEEVSFFEATVALSFLYFAEQGVDLAVVEVGLGGRLDATNIVVPRLALITTIGYDHADILGATLPEIAREKAGIIKPGVPVLTLARQPEVVAVIEEVAAAHQAPLHRVWDEVTVEAVRSGLTGVVADVQTPLRRYTGLQVGLPGPHQLGHAVLALRAAEQYGMAGQPAAVYDGLARVRQRSGLRGRLEVVQQEPLVVADVAHNAEGVAAALAFVEAHGPPGGQCYVVLGTMRDKDAALMATLLAEAEATVFLVALSTERAYPAQELAVVMADAGVAVGGIGTVAEGRTWFAAKARPVDRLLITGSHQVVAQVELQENG